MTTKNSMHFNLLDITATQAYPVSARYTNIEVPDSMSASNILPQLTVELLLCYEDDENIAIADDKTKLIKFLVNPVYPPSSDWILLPEINYKADGGSATAVVYVKF